MWYRLKEHCTMAGSRAVILSPTRELALQTAKVVKEIGRYTNLRQAILVGGDSMEAQFTELAANPDVIIATPGKSDFHEIVFGDFAQHFQYLPSIYKLDDSDLCSTILLTKKLMREGILLPSAISITFCKFSYIIFSPATLTAVCHALTFRAL